MSSSSSCPPRRALSTLSDVKERTEATELYQRFRGASKTMLDGAAVRGTEASYVTGGACNNGDDESARFVTVFADGVSTISSQTIDGLRRIFGPQTQLVHQDGTVVAVLPLVSKREPITIGEVAQWTLWATALIGSFAWLEARTLALGGVVALLTRAG